MKKLMIAAAVAMAAVASQAATFNWTTDSAVWGPVEGPYVAGQTYDADGDRVDQSGVMLGYTMILTSAADSSVSYTFTGSLDPDNDYTGLGKVNIDIVNDKGIPQDDTTYNVAITLEGTFDGTKMTSDVLIGEFTYGAIGDQGFESTAPASWTAAAVPEPTSGLLLLLGVAGLALRRRRA